MKKEPGPPSGLEEQKLRAELCVGPHQPEEGRDCQRAQGKGPADHPAGPKDQTRPLSRHFAA